jgi:hypothetical protein
MSRERKYKNEGDVKKHIKEILDECKCMFWDMPGATQFGRVGRHDFIICQRGFYWTIEAKYDENVPNDNQINFANSVARAGGISLCINEKTIGEVAYVVDYIDLNRKLPAGHDFEVYRK